MRKRFHTISIAALLATSSMGLTFAQETQPATLPLEQPATAPGDEALRVTITGVEGIVQVRGNENDAWKPAQVGMVLDQNAEFRTAPRSAVRFVIPPDQTITLDRLGTVKVLQAVRSGGKIKTNLGMKYGRTRYDIEAAGVEHESTISSPSSTLAVRGTKVSLYDQRPFVAQAVSLTGRAEFQDFKKRVRFGGRNAGKMKVDTNADGAASYARNEGTVDPNSPLARSGSENDLIQNLLSSGATLDYDYEKNIRVIRGGMPPKTDQALLPTLPGRLNFVLRWNENSDINLGVISPGTEPQRTVYPIGGYDLIANGGRTDFDHRGGENGGIEVVYWPNAFPEGIYRVGSVHISGPDTPATVDVFLDGKRVNILSGEGNVTTANVLITPIDPNIASGIGVGLVRLFPSTEARAASSIGPVQVKEKRAKKR